MKLVVPTCCSWLILLILVPCWGAAAPAAPDFDVEGLGERLRLSDYSGKVVYLDFWASWCAPCRRAFPWMRTMQSKHGDQGLKIIALSLDKSRFAAEQFLDEFEVNFQIGFDPDAKVAQAYKLRGMPTSYIIDRQGVLRHTHAGFFERQQEQYEAEIKQLLSEQ